MFLFSIQVILTMVLLAHLNCTCNMYYPYSVRHYIKYDFFFFFFFFSPSLLGKNKQVEIMILQKRRAAMEKELAGVKKK